MNHVTYIEISYPNFVLGQIIDPEEANQNNYEFTSKINTMIEKINLTTDESVRLEKDKANLVYVDGEISDLAGSGRTVETIKGNFEAMKTHKASDDHDTRYYNKSLLNGGQLNNLYYTKEELVPWLRGGDTNIKEEVFIITNSNNGDGTFSYRANGQDVIGELTEDGGQVFQFATGYYELGLNRVELIINDTLRRSVVSGGLAELTETSVVLTTPESNGTEVTARYYERVGIAAEYNIKLSAEKPPANDGKTMWFKVLE